MGELIRIRVPVDPVLEIAEITDRISKLEGGGKALLFENTGTKFPVLINALGSGKRISAAFRRNSLEELEVELDQIFRKLLIQRTNLWDKLKLLSQLKEFSGWMPVRSSQKGKCHEVVISNPDLGILPILKCWPEDGGRFITLPAVHTIDPETGAPNVGMYRMQVFGNNLTGMHWHRHKTGAAHFLKYKEAGKKMPVTVSLGGDPVYTYAAAAPMPENMDEYMLAGFLRKKGVRLVKSLTNDLYIPEDSDIVLEGFVDPEEDFILEGPFGDHTGFYSLTDFYPQFHITCITHRRDAIYPATIVGIPPMEDAWIGKATERIFLSPIRMSMVPEILDMDLPFSGVAHNLSIVKIKKIFPGQAQKVMHSLWGAGQMMFNKILVVIDDGFDIHDYPQFIRGVFDRFDPVSCLHFTTGPLDILDHSSSSFAFGSKLGIDLTHPMEDEISEFFFPSVQDEESEFDLPPWIEKVNDLGKTHNVPVLILGVNKQGNYNKEDFLKNLEMGTMTNRFKLILMVDGGVDLFDYFTIIWLTGANLDPKRDVSIVTGNTLSFVVVDATMKVHPDDRFRRDWPNVVISDAETIRKVDTKWKSYGLGDFITSPSLKFASLVKNAGAVNTSAGKM